jgi:hypothetical protein
MLIIKPDSYIVMILKLMVIQSYFLFDTSFKFNIGIYKYWFNYF